MDARIGVERLASRVAHQLRIARESLLNEAPIDIPGPGRDSPPVCSASVVTYRSDLSRFQRLIKGLIPALSDVAARYGGHAILYLVSNDGDPTFERAVVAELDEATARARERVRLRTFNGHGNIGYGAAHNLAIRATRSRYHLILNPDVELEPEAVLAGVRYLESDADCVLAAPHGLDRSGRYLRLAKRSPGVLTLALRAAHVAAGPAGPRRMISNYTYCDLLPADSPQRIELASGCCMLCRTEAIKRVHGFDERYFLFFEDFDLSKRLSRLGDLVEVPDFTIRHFGGDASRRGIVTIVRFVSSALRYFRLHGARRGVAGRIPLE
ncbi:MAG: glycosyltransferase [Pseudomonadota bacterium]